MVDQDLKSELEALQKVKDRPVELKSYKNETCFGCGTSDGLYRCESGHNRNFCKPCLTHTTRYGTSTLFTHKCLRPDCNFMPIGRIAFKDNVL